MKEELEKIREVAVAVATQGGKVLEAYFGHIRKISIKRLAGLVTEADQKAEETMISLIKESYPSHSILAEESGEEDRHSPFKWIIDPLDGTTNYAHQIPVFCSSVGVEKNGEIIVAAVSDPIHRDLYAAVKGEGAYKNDTLMSVSNVCYLQDALIATGFAYQKGEALERAVEILKPFMEITHGIRRCGSAVWDLCQVASGHFDGFWEKNLQPWDVIAGKLFIEEAGGKITKYDGSLATIYDQEIIVSNGLIHQEMVNIIARF